jgi:hypothetical protein
MKVPRRTSILFKVIKNGKVVSFGMATVQFPLVGSVVEGESLPE